MGLRSGGNTVGGMALFREHDDEIGLQSGAIVRQSKTKVSLDLSWRGYADDTPRILGRWIPAYAGMTWVCYWNDVGALRG